MPPPGVLRVPQRDARSAPDSSSVSAVTSRNGRYGIACGLAGAQKRMPAPSRFCWQPEDAHVVHSGYLDVALSLVSIDAKSRGRIISPRYLPHPPLHILRERTKAK